MEQGSISDLKYLSGPYQTAAGPHPGPDGRIRNFYLVIEVHVKKKFNKIVKNKKFECRLFYLISVGETTSSCKRVNDYIGVLVTTL